MESFLDYAPFPLVVENQEGIVLWSNRIARTVLGRITQQWKSENLHSRPEGDLVVVDGHKYTIKRQALAYEGESALLYWFIPVFSTVEQERDPLTGLPSFGSFLRTLEKRWLEAQANDFALAILTLDIARFGILNEVLGTQPCDDLLCQLAKRIAKLLDSDCLFARVNGDQFVICTAGSTEVSELHPNSIYAKGEALIHRMVNDLEKPFEAQGRSINLRISVGMSTSALCESPSDLLAASHRALLGAKNSPDSDWSVFNRDMLKAQARLKALATELEDALKSEALKLLYQPFVDLKNGKVVGLEALLRWDHPVHGTLLPHEFLDAAEVSNQMYAIGQWVIERVVVTAQKYPGLKFAINLSTQQLLDPKFLPVLKGALEQSGVKPEAIVIEILQSSSSTTLESVKRVLTYVSDAGVGLALDDADFDSRALALLSPLSLIYVKIDREIVANTHREETRTFCRAILALAKALGKKSLAVGIETLEQTRFLKQHGCDWGQGHHFAHPSSTDEIDGWVNKTFLV